jgi:hypothetical protein
MSRRLSRVDAWIHFLAIAVMAAIYLSSPSPRQATHGDQAPESGSAIAGTIGSHGLSVVKAQGG